MANRHNSQLCSSSQGFDTFFRNNGIKKEHCHGGKHNGVNCIDTMDEAVALFDDFCSVMKEKKLTTVEDTEITTQCDKFARLLSLMDVIWSNARGIDAGLLPTLAQIDQLDKALNSAKQMWIEMGVKTPQPKQHLTFDGHLLHQVRTCGGIADKADDTIEFQHQMSKKLRDRHRSVTSFQKREGCARRELPQTKSHEIQAHIDSHEAAVRAKKTSKRATIAAERQQEQREAKRVKREAIVDGQAPRRLSSSI